MKEKTNYIRPICQETMIKTENFLCASVTSTENESFIESFYDGDWAITEF